MRALIVTGMYPTARDPVFGCFVAQQVEAMRRADPSLQSDLLLFDGRASRLNYARAVVEIGRRVRAGRYDLVHAHYGLAGLVAVTQRRVPVLITLHGSDLHVPWQRALSRLAARWAHTVIVVSERMKPLVQDAAARGVRVVPCGIDLDRFQPAPIEWARARLGWRARVPRVLFPGDPARRVKRYGLFADVIDRVRRAGWSVEQAVLKDVPPASVPDVMNACDAMLMTSSTEGSPMVVKEAMACNLPIVSTDVGDVSALVGGCAGCAVVPGDTASLAAALAAALVVVLGRARRSDGRERIACLSETSIASRVLAIYGEVAGSISRRPEGIPAPAS